MIPATEAGHIDFSQLVRPTETVIWTQGAGEPLTLIEPLLAQRHAIGKFRVFLGASYSGVVRPEHADVIAFQGLGAVGSNRALCKEGALDVLPCHLSEIPRYFENGVLAADVVLIQLSAENAQGNFTIGAVNGYIQAAMRRARLVIGEVNDQAPRTASREQFDGSRLHLVVRTSRALVTTSSKALQERDRAIARHVASFVPDGAVLQIGIGTIPNAVLEILCDRRDLGIHSGTLGDAVLDLITRGAVTNATKPIDTGKTVTGNLAGSKRLYDFANDNPDILIEPVNYTHDPRVIGAFDRFIAVNSAIEVDLTGQVNAEVIGTEYAGTIGGQSDFVRGALASARGRSIIALPARIGSNGGSRIVSQIKGHVVTTQRADADVIVTEFGAAELRGRSIRERVRAMINIADPAFREDLEREAREVVAGY